MLAANSWCQPSDGGRPGQWRHVWLLDFRVVVHVIAFDLRLIYVFDYLAEQEQLKGVEKISSFQNNETLDFVAGQPWKFNKL